MTKRSLFAMTLMLTAAITLSAQDMSIPLTWGVQNHDVRSQAMGGTSSLSNQFGMSGIGNPASIVFFDYSLTKNRIGSKQSESNENFFTIGGTAGWHYFKPGNTHYAYASAAARIAIVGVSASYIAGWAPNWPWSSASPCHQQVNIGVGVRVLPYLSLGANVKYFSENTDASAKLFSGDIFAMADYSGFRATLGVRNLSGSFTRGDTSYKMPYSYVVGLGVKQDLIKVLAFEVNGEYELFNYGGNFVHRAGVGANLRFLGFLSVCGGYNWGGNSPLPTYGSVGLGVGIVKIIEIEACYMFNRNNNLNMIGAQLSIKF